MSEKKSEDRFVAWLRDRYGTAARERADGVLIGIGDDMAAVAPSLGMILFTCDMLMDGVDFDSRVHGPEAIGRKALAASLSDCAAMAVRPRWAVVSLALPEAWGMEQAQGLFLGMEELARRYNCAIVGGDTNSWKHPLVLDVMLAAEPWEGVRPVRRDGMRPGDWVHVTGELGGSLAGRHLSFEPRVREAKILAEALGKGLHAMMDLSDGISTDAGRMAGASGCGMEFEEAALTARAGPAAREAARDGSTLISHVMDDGEDFELMFAADEHCAEKIDSVLRSRIDVAVARVGRAIEEKGVWLRKLDGSRIEVEARGWQHFV